ncbi:MAG: glycosyltransferase family 4 protein [Hyphomicrobiaceae bacterium]
MSKLHSVAFIGNHLPRRCGIATFTHDLHRAVATAHPNLDTCVVAMNDQGTPYSYPPDVRFQIRDHVAGDYRDAAKAINGSGFEIASLQHEYGIFGGEAGRNILELLPRLKMPIVTTLHTILAEPSPAQRAVLDQVIEASAKLVVMSDKGRQFLRAVHGVPAAKIEMIPHGIPEYPFIEPLHAKLKFGYTGRTVILTFGLLSPSKGIETVIDAMPAIIRSCPTAVYVILGATHPNLVRDQGEAYRDSLIARAHRLGVADHVVFCNQFVDQATLLDYISMCDVYVTPYLNEAQMTSGTLAYSFGLGKAVVSTPYWHAQELLADGRGILVPIGDALAIGAEIAGLLTNDVRRHAMRKRAYANSRSMVWGETAKTYVAAFDAALEANRPGSERPRASVKPRTGDDHEAFAVPAVETGHLRTMCDSTGLLQHAVHNVPDRSHGYCVDDNARALLLACALAHSGEAPLPEKLVTRFAAFIEHAWNPDTLRFRNFMSYGRQWLEPIGSEDSHGRTLWALAQCAATDTNPSRRQWAINLFRKALPTVEEFTSPRAWAFTLLGLDAYCTMAGGDLSANRLQRIFADRLLALLKENTVGAWHWYENVLAYDNARLPQAMIETGMATGNHAYTEAGLSSLRWLMARQTARSGCFRPVGSDSFGKFRQAPEKFDQQPVEATATIAACLAASRADTSADWTSGASVAFDWFLGANDLGVAVADLVTGGCLDGLHADRPNQNMGAESVLSYLLALVEIRQLRRAGVIADTTETDAAGRAPTLALSA